MSTIEFGDTVRVRRTHVTDSAGLADLVGTVYGITTPSVTGVSVIGAVTDDRAINVFFDDRDGTFWFATDLLDFVDHGAGAVATIDGSAQRWTRAEDGSWLEEPGGRRVKGLFERFRELFKRLF